MPKCIDDPSRSYTGNEPSPKGLGYCAHTQDVGTTKTGNDGNTWTCLLYTSPSPRDAHESRMPSSA